MSPELGLRRLVSVLFLLDSMLRVWLHDGELDEKEGEKCENRRLEEADEYLEHH